MRVLIVGAGAAGTAAAWAARRAGAEVTVAYDRAGATSLYSGALDLTPWEEASEPSADERDLSLFAAAFDAWTMGPGPSRVATIDGVVRSARAHDTALLDLSHIAGRTVCVAETPLHHFDARWLSASFAASTWARDTRTRFEPVKVPALFDAVASGAPCFDVASRANTEAGSAHVARCLQAARPSAEAWLLGPWLGTEPGAAERVRAALGVPCGETTSPLGGPAGARFDAARDALFTSLGIVAVRGPVTRLRSADSGWTADFDGRPQDPPAFDLAALAVGGVCGGGLVFGSSTFHLSIDVAATVALDGRALSGASSLSGAISRAEDAEALVRLGILADGATARGGNGLLVAGDCVEGRPRTALEAARAGIRAMRTIRNSVAPPRSV